MEGEIMKTVLLVAPFIYNDSAEDFLANGFRELGWTVICQKTQFMQAAPEPSSDIAMTFVVKGTYTLAASSILVDQLPGQTVLYLMDNLTRKPEQHGPSVEIVDLIEYQQSVEAVFGQNGACDKYDHILLAHDPDLFDYPFKLFPVGYDPSTHYWDGRGLPKTTDVCFIGTCHRPNREWIAQIPNIEIYGNNWSALRYPIYNVSKRKQVYQTKVNINQHLPNDTANMRQFEIPAMHGFLLSDTAWPFEDGKEVVTYKDPEDCKKQVAYWLEEEDEREKIAEAGYRACLKHSYANRIKELLAEVGL